MNFADMFQRFASAVFPKNMADGVATRLKALARAIHVAPGHPVKLDEGVDQFVFLAEGATKLVAYASAGREQVVAFHFAGDLVSVPVRAAHSYTLNALSNCDLLVFPAAEFLDLAAQDADVMRRILLRSMMALDRSREKSVALGRKTAQERLAGFLASMAERIGAEQGGNCVLNLPMSRRDIADSLGLTIETISREFGDLRTQGLLETSGRSIVRLIDLDAIRSRAGHLMATA